MNDLVKKRFFSLDLFLVLLYMSAIFYLSSQSRLHKALFPVNHIDKLYHFLAYMLLGYLCARLFSHLLSSPSAIFFAASVLSALYGLSDEFHQSFVPGRDASWGDALADALGGIAGALLWWALYRWQQKKKTPTEQTA